MRKTDGSAALQEREARASDRYMEACITEAKAAGVYEYLRALREAAAMKLEIFRTQSSNFRSMKIS
jgi:serine/threonine-protein kinase RIO1